jgi:acylphosphatase
MNISNGNVVGVAQGPTEGIDKLKYWLQNTGSPKSRIDNAIFTNDDSTEVFNDFVIRK